MAKFKLLIVFAAMVFMTAGETCRSSAIGADGSAAADVLLSVGQKGYSFTPSWKALLPLPTSEEVPAYKVLVGAENATWRVISPEHVRLDSGTVVVAATKSALFVSQKMKGEQFMVRVAPGAVALVSCSSAPVVANVSKRCCGGVIVYLPVPKSDYQNSKISVVPGQSYEIKVRDLSPTSESGGDSHGLEGTIASLVGPLQVSSSEFDLVAAMQKISDLPFLR